MQECPSGIPVALQEFMNALGGHRIELAWSSLFIIQNSYLASHSLSCQICHMRFEDLTEEIDKQLKYFIN